MKALTYIEHGKFALLAKCQTWGELNPVTGQPENSKAYNRKRTQDWKKELPYPASIIYNSFRVRQ